MTICRAVRSGGTVIHPQVHAYEPAADRHRVYEIPSCLAPVPSPRISHNTSCLGVEHYLVQPRLPFSTFQCICRCIGSLNWKIAKHWYFTSQSASSKLLEEWSGALFRSFHTHTTSWCMETRAHNFILAKVRCLPHCSGKAKQVASQSAIAFSKDLNSSSAADRPPIHLYT